jgi:hypothetical protein
MEVTAEELLAMSTTYVTSVGSCRTTRPGFSIRPSARSNPSLLSDASIAVHRLRALSTVGPLLNSHTRTNSSHHAVGIETQGAGVSSVQSHCNAEQELGSAMLIADRRRTEGGNDDA